jgi:signal transduction histidine kinase
MDHGSRAGIGLIVAASRIAGLAAIVAVGALAALRIGLTGHPAMATSGDAVPLLTAVALLLVVGLAWQRRPTLAWLSTIGAAVIVTIDLATYARLVRAETDDNTWRWLVLAICLVALLGSGSAAAYAIGRRRLPRVGIVLGSVVGIGTVAIACVAALATSADSTLTSSADSPIGNVRLVTRAVLVVIPLLTLAGLIGDALPAAERATKRVRLMPMASAPGAGRRLRAGAWLRAFGDEVGPGRSRARRAVLAERSSIARDLHADVVPALRRALADAQHAAPPERLTASLRQVLAEVESLGASRHAIQLEIGGLVAALEWLAEQVESRSDVSVTLDVADAPPTTGPPPAEVAAAAFRVAGLALDNVVRHAPGSRAAITVIAAPDLVDLTIRDDGPGLTADKVASAMANGRRGILDMASEAAACGADVQVSPDNGGVGTVVSFRWEIGSRPGR